MGEIKSICSSKSKCVLCSWSHILTAEVLLVGWAGQSLLNRRGFTSLAAQKVPPKPLEISTEADLTHLRSFTQFLRGFASCEDWNNLKQTLRAYPQSGRGTAAQDRGAAVTALISAPTITAFHGTNANNHTEEQTAALLLDPLPGLPNTVCPTPRHSDRFHETPKEKSCFSWCFTGEKLQ